METQGVSVNIRLLLLCICFCHIRSEVEFTKVSSYSYGIIHDSVRQHDEPLVYRIKRIICDSSILSSQDFV